MIYVAIKVQTLSAIATSMITAFHFYHLDTKQSKSIFSVFLSFRDRAEQHLFKQKDLDLTQIDDKDKKLK